MRTRCSFFPVRVCFCSAQLVPSSFVRGLVLVECGHAGAAVQSAVHLSVRRCILPLLPWTHSVRGAIHETILREAIRSVSDARRNGTAVHQRIHRNDGTIVVKQRMIIALDQGGALSVIANSRYISCSFAVKWLLLRSNRGHANELRASRRTSWSSNTAVCAAA